MYLHDKGEQFYLHYDLWPTVPFIHHSKPDEKFLDIVIEKQLQLHYENCNEETFRYFGKYKNFKHIPILITKLNIILYCISLFFF